MQQPDVRPCLLIRVSTDDQDTRQQRYEALEWIRQQFGVALPDDAIFEEDGVSGRNELKDRPGLNAAFGACMSGRFTHLVVRKIDRSGRNLALMADIIRQLDTAGVSFIAQQEQIDTRQFGAKLVAHMLLAFAEHFSDNLREEVRKGKRKRKRLGMPNGHLPFGCANGPDGVATRDDQATVTLCDGSTSTRYDGLLHIFNMAADGVRMADITRTINRLGYTTHSHKGERIFATSTVRRILENRFYLGEIPIDKRHKAKNPGWMPGLHEPLIDQDLWDRAHAQLARHAGHPQSGSKGRHPHPFGRGIVQCVSCAERGVSAFFHIKPGVGKAHYHSLICGERAMRHQCQEPTVRECDLEEQMEAMLARFSIPEGEREALLARYATTPTETPQNDAEAERARIHGAMDKLDAKLDMERISTDEYRSRMRQLKAELAGIQDTPAAMPEVDVLRETAAYLADVASLWRDADTWERVELVQLLFARIWVHDRQIVRLDAAPAFASWFAIMQEGGAE